LSAVPAALACFHCGLPVPPEVRRSVQIDGVDQPMCCPGCAAVAATIVASGLGDYYRQRTGYSVNAGEPGLVPEGLGEPGGSSGLAVPAGLAAPAGRAAEGVAAADVLPIYDSAELAGQFTAADGHGEGTFTIEGLRCAACVWLIERQLARLPGVEAVELNVARGRVFVRWDNGRCRPSHILGALRAIGYVAYPYAPDRHGEQLERAEKKLFRQLFVAGLSMMQVMNYVVVFYLDKHDAVDAAMTALIQ